MLDGIGMPYRASVSGLMGERNMIPRPFGITAVKKDNISGTRDQVFKVPAGKTVVAHWGDGTIDKIDGPYDAIIQHNYQVNSACRFLLTGDIDSITEIEFSNSMWIADLQDVLVPPNQNIVTLNFTSGLFKGDLKVLGKFYGSSLTNLIVGNSTAYHYTPGYVLPDLSGCAAITLASIGLDQQEVDDFLVDINASAGNSGTFLILGGNAVPSAVGLAAKASLELKGWVVLVDT